MIEDYNRYEMARREKLTVVCGLAVMMAFAGYIFYGTLLFCLLLPFVYKPGMKAYCGFRVRRRKNQLLIQFRDLLFSLSASFAAGRHMEEAMEEARENLEELYGSRGLMAGELEHMLRSIQETGEGEVELWQSFARRSGLEDAADFTQVFSACRETGGNLIQAVNKAASVIGEKIAVEMEIRTIVSQKKLEGRIITAMPAIIVVFLQAVSPDYLEVMYVTFGGRILMSLALFAMAGAYVMIERITDIEV